jgi:hypothetical protein
MKKILLMVLAMLTIGSQLNVCAAKKDKKEGKGLKWEWDGTKSGNANIDKYLLQIDTLYHKVQEYQNSLEGLEIKEDTFSVNGKYYIMSHMEDASHNIYTRGQVNWQCVQAYSLGASIILDMTNAGLGSANAALELPQLGFKALKFAKYVKGGPAVISEGTKAIKAVRGKWIINSRRWKTMKDGAIEDASSIGYTKFTSDVVEKLNKCYYIREITNESPEYEDVIKHFTDKTPEEIAKEAEEQAQKLAQSTIMPEDKSKTLDETPNLEDELG